MIKPCSLLYVNDSLLCTNPLQNNSSAGPITNSNNNMMVVSAVSPLRLYIMSICASAKGNIICEARLPIQNTPHRTMAITTPSTTDLVRVWLLLEKGDFPDMKANVVSITAEALITSQKFI